MISVHIKPGQENTNSKKQNKIVWEIRRKQNSLTIVLFEKGNLFVCQAVNV